MNEEELDKEVPRSLRLPLRVWQALDMDAARCRRSANKQLEALLVTYYNLDDVEMANINLMAPRSQATEAYLSDPKSSRTRTGRRSSVVQKDIQDAKNFVKKKKGRA
ncbi:MAG TPA: hypothetical protein VEF04_05475 [Blastocatellia bacterium]|nr:hypothetical protein [Blastocatellia bacterium]